MIIILAPMILYESTLEQRKFATTDTDGDNQKQNQKYKSVKVSQPTKLTP
jgi:hypothetical protein